MDPTSLSYYTDPELRDMYLQLKESAADRNNIRYAPHVVKEAEDGMRAIATEFAGRLLMRGI